MFDSIFNRCSSIKAYEKEKNYILQVLLPGIGKEDVQVSFDKNILTIATKKETFFNEKFNYQTRLITTKENTKLDFDKASASMENGVLTITIPIKTSSSLLRKLKIQ